MNTTGIYPYFFSADNFKMLFSVVQNKLDSANISICGKEKETQQQLLNVMKGVYKMNASNINRENIPMSQLNMILNKEVLERSLSVLFQRNNDLPTFYQTKADSTKHLQSALNTLQEERKDIVDNRKLMASELFHKKNQAANQRIQIFLVDHALNVQVGPLMF